MRRFLTVLIHILAILIPMALGWGLNDLPEFFHQLPRACLIVAIFLGTLAILVLRIDLNPLRTGAPAITREGATLLVLAVCSIALLAFLPYADRRGMPTIVHPSLHASARWLGLILTVIAGAVRILALRQLGPQFSAYVTLQPGHALVQTGIYSRIRHPLYLSLLLAGPGVALVFASQLVWPILAVTIAFIANRIKAEERLLAKHFGPQFQSYRQHSSMLLPLFRVR